MDRCTGCMYFGRNKGNGEGKSANAGQCRRNAPQLSPINQKSYMIEGVWPTVRGDDWCGEWKAQVRRSDPARIDPARVNELLGLTAVIQVFVYPDAWATHLSWAAPLLYLAARGGGRVARDRVIGLA